MPTSFTEPRQFYTHKAVSIGFFIRLLRPVHRAREAIRWNAWITVRPVRFEDEAAPRARSVRLASTAMRVGDPVTVENGGRTVVGEITAVAHSVVHVRRVLAGLS